MSFMKHVPSILKSFPSYHQVLHMGWKKRV